MSRRGWLLFAAMSVIWGLPYLLIKIAVVHVSPTVLVFGRTAIGTGLLCPLAIARGDLRAVARAWLPLLAFSATEVAVPWVLLSDAEVRLTSSLSGLLVALVPLVGMVLAWVAGAGERLGRVQMAGLLLGLLGVAAVVGLDLGHVTAGAMIEMAVVVCCYAAGPQILVRWLRHLPGVGVVFASLLVATVAYAPVAVLQRPSHWPSWPVVASIVALGVVCTALAFVLFFELVSVAGPVRSTIVTYVNPAVAVVLGVAVRHEPVTWGLGVGFLLILGGSVLAARRGRPTGPPGPARRLRPESSQAAT